MHPAMKTTGNARVKGQLAGSGQRVPVPGKRGGKREWGPAEHGAGGRERRHSNVQLRIETTGPTCWSLGFLRGDRARAGQALMVNSPRSRTLELLRR